MFMKDTRTLMCNLSVAIWIFMDVYIQLSQGDLCFYEWLFPCISFLLSLPADMTRVDHHLKSGEHQVSSVIICYIFPRMNQKTNCQKNLDKSDLRHYFEIQTLICFVFLSQWPLLSRLISLDTKQKSFPVIFLLFFLIDKIYPHLTAHAKTPTRIL